MAEEEVVQNGDYHDHEKKTKKEKKIMVAIDESDNSYNALMWVLDNLKETITRLGLVIFMAQTPTQSNYTFAASLGSARIYSPLSSTPEFVNSVKKNKKKLVLALLEKAKDICASRGVSVVTGTEEGDPGTAICDAVRNYDVSLLVVGERGVGQIKRAILGSVSNYCVNNASCPVLVVKKP